MKKISCSGPDYKYLGHFSKQRFLDQGHNDYKESENPKLDYGGGTAEEKKERAEAATRGFMKAANDNPVSNFIKWMKSSK